MKSKICISIAIFVMFLVILTTSSFAISITEKTDSYKDGALIYGSTRFETDVVITAAKAYDAGVNEAKLNVALGNDLSKIKPVTPYFFDGASWYQITDSETEPAKALTEEQVKEVESSLDIFFVNNEEKVLEVKYDGVVDENSIWSPNDNVTFEDGKFYIPVLTQSFTFLSNNVANEVQTNLIESVMNGEEIVENVKIVPEWAAFEINGEYYSEDTVAKAFASGKNLEVKLLKDVDLKTALVVSSKVTVDLGLWNTLTAKEDTEGNGIFMVKAGGDLTINGEGTIDSACQTNDYSMAIWAKETGKVTINGGTFTNRGAKDKEDNGKANNNELIYARDAAQVVINGGEFIGNIDNETYGARYTLNLRDQNTDTASIIVKGGTFEGYDPANSKSENPTANLVADGFVSTENNGIYSVTKKAN